MTISMYQASVPAFIRHLENLEAILKKAEVHANAKKIDHGVLINARLAPDMFPLVRQVQIATDGVKGCVARLAGLDVPSFPDTETSFAELYARINKVIDFAKSVTASQIDGSEDRDITFKRGKDGQWNFKGQDYLTTFVLPNFYFHITTTYAILRHNGVELGKLDYLGMS